MARRRSLTDPAGREEIRAEEGRGRLAALSPRLRRGGRRRQPEKPPQELPGGAGAPAACLRGVGRRSAGGDAQDRPSQTGPVSQCLNEEQHQPGGPEKVLRGPPGPAPPPVDPCRWRRLPSRVRGPFELCTVGEKKGLKKLACELSSGAANHPGASLGVTWGCQSGSAPRGGSRIRDQEQR